MKHNKCYGNGKERKAFRNCKRKPLKSKDFRGFGAASQIRTGDLILTKDALYLLSYSSIYISLGQLVYYIL